MIWVMTSIEMPGDSHTPSEPSLIAQLKNFKPHSQRLLPLPKPFNFSA
jgi:hypothetical protein